MKKIILITGVIVVVLGAGVLLWLFANKSGSPLPSQTSTSSFSVSQTSTPSSTNNPSTLPSAPTQGSSVDVFSIATPQGTVLVNNFYKNAVQVFSDGSGALIIRDPAYDVLYFQPDGSFTISILKKPVLANRTQAESAFLQELNISQADACKLKVLVGVPISIDPQYSGKNLGLSFCQ